MKRSAAALPSVSPPPYRAAVLASLAVLALYLVTLGPSSAMWDTSEYIAAAYTMGLPHPPGNPLFVLLGRVFSILPVAANVATRINLLAALCSAASAGLWFLVTERVLSTWIETRWQRLLCAALSAAIGATAFTVWSQSVVNEKVYTVSLVGVALVAWLTVRWCDLPDGRWSDRILVLIAFLLGLGYSNHMAGFIPAPAVALAVLLRRPRVLVRPRLLAAMAGALLLGISPFATQPIRAAYFPAINEGEVTGCRTAFQWDCTLSAETWRAFKYNFNREQYGKPSVIVRQAPASAQVAMWWYYFRWQWLRDAYQQHQTAQAILAALFLALGAMGGWVHWKRARQSFWFFGPLMATLTLGLIYYLNFRYGGTQSAELGDVVSREVRDRDYFFLWGFSAWSVWAALGLTLTWESLASLFGTEQERRGKLVIERPRRLGWTLAAPVLVLALVPLLGNWGASTRRNDTTTRDFAHDLLNSVEPYGILVTAGDNDTFPLWYAQEVEGIRRDVTVANTSLMGTDWYVRQLARTTPRPYDALKGPALYRAGPWTQPSGPPLHMTLEEADSIPYVYPLEKPFLFQGPGEIRARVSRPYLTKADIAVLRMIQDSNDRPVYFGRTVGAYADSLGLRPFLLTQGLAQKLLHRMPAAGRDTVYYPGEGYVDVSRTRDLWLDDSLGPKSLIRKGGWPDLPSAIIPALYVRTGLMLRDVLTATGQDSAAAVVARETLSVARATHIADYIDFRSAPPIQPGADTAISGSRPVPAIPPARRTTVPR